MSIEGFPFLTQVAARDLKQIDINASNFTVKQVVISSLHATATGVHPNASFNGATINQINGTVVVSFTTITNLVPVPGLTVTADPADGPDAIKLNSSLGGATGKIEQTSASQITVQVGNLTGLAGLASLLGGSSPRVVVHLRHTAAAGRPGGPLGHRDQPGNRRHGLGAEHHAVPVKEKFRAALTAQYPR